MVTITKTGSPGGLIILGLIFFVCGALLTYQNLKEMRYQAISGFVQTSEIKKIAKTRSGSKTSSVAWYLLVDYEYTVDGKLYKSDNVASATPMSDSFNDKPPSKKLLALAEKFKQGEQVTVYIDRNKPYKSILLHSPYYGIWGILIGFLFFAGALYWRRLRAAS
ncbi:DUF3592 domain-containing protein [Hellea sp.]|nr:DUF3592 domain-containing protein [Hellea sp.]